jgi:opacity protein-like surface antigen
MKTVTLAAALTLLLAVGTRAQAQSWEVSALAGFTPSAGLDRQAPELDQLAIRGGFTFGGQAGYLFGQRWGAEVLWTRQQSGLQVETADGDADLFTFHVDDLHGDAVYHFADRNARLRLFVFGGLGATFFSGGGLPSEAKISWSLGGGAKYFPWKSIGLRAHVRYKPVILNDKDAGDFCDPFGFCQSWLGQFELAAGVVARF